MFVKSIYLDIKLQNVGVYLEYTPDEQLGGVINNIFLRTAENLRFAVVASKWLAITIQLQLNVNQL